MGRDFTNQKALHQHLVRCKVKWTPKQLRAAIYKAQDAKHGGFASFVIATKPQIRVLVFARRRYWVSR